VPRIRTATAIAVMLRPKLCGVSQGMGQFPWLQPQHIFEWRCDYRVLKKAINDGSVRCWGLTRRSEMSTLARAFAFISMSTSA